MGWDHRGTEQNTRSDRNRGRRKHYRQALRREMAVSSESKSSEYSQARLEILSGNPFYSSGVPNSRVKITKAEKCLRQRKKPSPALETGQGNQARDEPKWKGTESIISPPRLGVWCKLLWEESWDQVVLQVLGGNAAGISGRSSPFSLIRNRTNTVEQRISESHESITKVTQTGRR